MIISASRRTDIPAFYAEWFIERIRAGYCTVPNPFNAKQISTISLAPEDVDAIVFWTRNPRPLFPSLTELDKRGYCYVFLQTLVDYPRWLESHSPATETAIESFVSLANRIGPERVIWRYDPMVFTATLDFDYHRSAFGKLAAALSGSTYRVKISIMDDYAKTRRRLAHASSEAYRDKATLQDSEEFGQLISDMGEIAARQGMRIESCAETLDLQRYGVEPGKCIDADLLNQLFGLQLSAKIDPSQRPTCQCVASRDIGMYNSCLFGCQYCYATGSFEKARERYVAHDPETPSLY